MDVVCDRRELPSMESNPIDESSEHSVSAETTAKKRTDSLRSRINMFDNGSSPFPVKTSASPRAAREKTARKPFASPVGQANRKSKSFQSPTSSYCSSSSISDDEGPEGVDQFVENKKATETPTSPLVEGSEGAVDDGTSKDETALSRASGLRAKMKMFEHRSHETVDDSAIRPEGNSKPSKFRVGMRGSLHGHSEHIRSNSSAERSTSSFLASASVSDVEDDVPAEAPRRSWKQKLVRTKVHEDIPPPSIQDTCEQESIENPAGSVTPKVKSWKTKRIVPAEKVNDGQTEANVTSTTGTNKPRGDHDGADTTETEAPKVKSWKPKRIVSAQTAKNDGHEDAASAPVSNGLTRAVSAGAASNDLEANTSPQPEPTRKKSWKTKRIISAGDVDDGKEAAVVPSANKHSDALEAPQTPRSSSSTTKDKKLQDRIKMFNNKQTSPTPQKVFLGSNQMTKLVQKKEEAQDVSELKSKINDGASKKEFEDSFRSEDLVGPLVDEPMMSLDRSLNMDNMDKRLTRTKSFVRRGQLKAQNSNSALIRQKDKDKNAVFANHAVIIEEDISSETLPEYAKDKTETKTIMTALRKNFVFEDMDANEMDKLVLAMQEVHVTPGRDIITQGKPGDYFYVVSRGEVTFFVDGQKVGTAGPGNAFGELALLYKCPRSATVRATDRNTSLFRVNERTFTIMMHSETKKSEEEKRQLLRSVPFLSALGSEDITRLCSLMGPVLFSTGDYIVRKGDRGSSFFIIRDGKLRVTEIFVGGTSYEDVSLEKGDYFGEDALISDEPRAANVVALCKGSAFAIERESVRKVLGDFGSLISKTQDRQKLESMKIFQDADLSSSNFDKLAQLITERTFAKGEVIFKSGKNVDAALYIVREGAVKITPSDKQASETIKAGGAFGQDHLIAGAGAGDTTVLSTFTAKVLEDCVCGVLTLEDCRTAFDTSVLGDRTFSEGNEALENERAAIRKIMQSNVKYEDLDKDRIVGEGQFGTVWLVRADPHKTKDKSKMLEFALKVQFKEDPVRRGGAIEAIKREMTVIRQLNHPFIIDLVDTYETEDKLMMLTEPVNGGELWSRIHREDESGEWTSGMPEDKAKFYALVVADVISYMHRQHIIFRDLKPENVLIDLDGYPKLCDFGFAKYVPDDTTFTFCGTPNYLAPEIVLNRGHGAAVDHWALGIVTYEMITGENPFYFEGQDHMALLQAITQEDFYPLQGAVSRHLIDFVSELLEKDPVQRLGSLAGGEKGILKHEWFSDLDLDQIRKKIAKAPDAP